MVMRNYSRTFPPKSREGRKVKGEEKRVLWAAQCPLLGSVSSDPGERMLLSLLSRKGCRSGRYFRGHQHS